MIGRLRRVMLFSVIAMTCASVSAGDVVVYAGSMFNGIDAGFRSDVSIVIRGDRIVDIRDGFIGQRCTRVIDLRDHHVLPGLIDAHTHVSAGGGWENLALGPLDAALEGVPNLQKTLEAGFTTIRNVGANAGTDIALKRAVERGLITGPRMLISLESIGPTGGHSDRANGVDPGFGNRDWANYVVDGADAMVRRIREHHRRGADLIKIMPSGGVLSVGDDPDRLLMTEEEIAAAVKTAHALGMRVAAHATGRLPIETALRLGVDTIEHGTLADTGTFELFRRTGGYLVPTLVVGSRLLVAVERGSWSFPDDVEQKIRRFAPLAGRNVTAAYRSGVSIVFGTDSLSDHGRNADQFAMLMAAGMSTQDVLFATTRNAAAALGRSADLGSLAAG